MLGQDVFHCIRPLEFFETDRKNTPIDIRLPLGWLLSGPPPSTTGLISTCFMAVTQREMDSKLADQIRRWYDIESHWAYKQVKPRSAADAQARKKLQDIAYHDGCRYPAGMIWADERIRFTEQLFFGINLAHIPWTPSWEKSELEGTAFNDRPWRSFKGLYRRSLLV